MDYRIQTHMYFLTEAQIKQRFRFQFKQNQEWIQQLEEQARKDPTFTVQDYKFQKIKMPTSKKESFLKLDFNERKKYIKVVFKRIFKRLVVFIKMCRHNNLVLDISNLDVSQFVTFKFGTFNRESHVNMLVEFLRMDPFFNSPQFNFLSTRIQTIKNMHIKINSKIKDIEGKHKS